MDVNGGDSGLVLRALMMRLRLTNKRRNTVPRMSPRAPSAAEYTRVDEKLVDFTPKNNVSADTEAFVRSIVTGGMSANHV